MSYDGVATSDRALETDGPSLSSRPKKIAIHANEGYGFPVAGRATQVRLRSKKDVYLELIKAELKRCGAHTRKISIHEVKGQAGSIFYLNIFSFRGLDPDLALTDLKELPDRCGWKRVFAELSQLEERVESGAERILEVVG
jgi:hypothetical protein